MIERLEISGVHTEVGEDLKKYVTKKISKLDRFISRRAREAVHVQVKLKESRVNNKKNCTCEVVMHLPHEDLMVK